MWSALLNLIPLIRKLVDLVAWAIIEGTKQLEERAAQRRREKVRDAVEQAKAAKTTEEKARAACALEKTINPDSDCDSTSRRE